MRASTSLILSFLLAAAVPIGEPLEASQQDSERFATSYVLHSGENDSDPLSARARLHVEDVPLSDALSELEVRSGVPVAFSSTHLPGDRIVSCRCSDLSVAQAVSILLRGTSFELAAIGDHLLIRERETPDVQIVNVDWSPDPFEEFGSASEVRGTLVRPVARQGTVTGRVIDSQTRQPIQAAQVHIPALEIGALSQASGRFLLMNVPAGTHEVRAERIGYASVSQEVSVTAGETVEINFELAQSALALDEIVITGTAGGSQVRALGNVVSRVQARDMQELVPVGNVQDMLGTRASGVNVMTNQGNVGGGSHIQIRGVASRSLNNFPLIYIDGVRVDNTRGGPTGMRDSRPSNRMNDLHPEDIESIEVIKGPAAATLYGTEASNGVIQIITKRGASGEPTIDFTVRQGANFLLDPGGRLPKGYRRDAETGELKVWSLYFQETGQGFEADDWTGPTATENWRGACHLRGCEPFQYGHVQSYQGSVRGGTDLFRYYASATWDDSEGYVWYNNQDKFTGRGNIDVFLRENLDLSLSFGTVSSDTRFAQAAAPYGIVDAIIWGHSERVRNRGWYTAPGEELEDIEGREKVDRYTWSLQANWRPWEWFSHRLTIGQDVGTSTNTRLFPRHPIGDAHYFGQLALGDKRREDLTNRFGTWDYAGTATYDATSELELSTSFGFQYFTKRLETGSATGRVFPSPGVTSVGATAVNFGFEDVIENNTVGVYLQEQLSWRNRVFLTAAIRADDNSAFGQDFEFVTYPKLSASWVVNEEDFWNVSWVNSLRLRAAWGQAGQQPDVFAAARLYEPRTGPGDASVLSPQNIGNPDLEPEKGEEIEVGFDAEFFQERIALGYTFYHQRTKDAILSRQLPLSSGFPGSQFVNLGEVKNVGMDVELAASLYQGTSFRWDLGWNFSWNENEVVDMGGLPAQTGSFNATREGYPVQGYWGVKIVSAEPGGDNPICLQEDGSTRSCHESAPRLFFGPQFPEYQSALNTTVTLFDNLRLYANLDYKGGYHRGDGDVGHAHMLMVNTQATVGFEDGSPPDPIALAYLRESGTWGRATFIHDAAFLRFREISANYTLPVDYVERFGASRASVSVSARNLWFLWRAEDNILGRPVIDPETRNRGQFVGQTQTKLPPSSSIVTTFRLTF